MSGRATRREPPNVDYDALFELSDTPTLELNAAGVVHRLNASAARLLDISPAAARGQVLDELLDADVTTALASDDATVVSAMTVDGRAPLVVRSVQRTLQGPDGERFTVQLSPAPAETRQDATRHGEPMHWSAMDDISHNLGTPLSIIGGYAETLASHVDELDAAEIARAAAAIHRHASRAIDELQALQARVRLDAGGAGTVPTAVLLAWLRRMLDPNLVASNAALVGNWDVDLVTLDIAVARQALLNACGVALHLAPRPHVLELSVSLADEGTVFDLTLDSADGPVALGSDAQFTIDVTRQIVDAGGGTYRAPTAEDPSQRIMLPMSASGGRATTLPTIPVVVIEDDHDTAVLIRTSLRNSSTLFSIEADERTFADGLAAVTRTQPRIVLLDQNLPDRTGTEGLAELRAAAPDAQIVVLSVRGRDRTTTDANIVWLEKGRVLADLGTELIGVLAAGE